MQYGYLSKGSIADSTLVQYRGVCEIIEARVYEIFSWSTGNFLKSGIKDTLSSGVVITAAGVSFLKGSRKWCEIMDLPVGLVSTVHRRKFPVYSSGVGIVEIPGRKKVLLWR